MRALLSLLPSIAWLVSLSFSLWVRALLNGAGATVLVPLVSLPPESQGDVVSDVTGFAIVVGWALGCVLLVEPAKLAAARLATRFQLRTYGLLVSYQIILFADTIRSQTFDWWKWLLSLVGAVTLSPAASMYEVGGFHFPWLSCVVAAVAGLIVFWSLPKPLVLRSAPKS